MKNYINDNLQSGEEVKMIAEISNTAFILPAVGLVVADTFLLMSSTVRIPVWFVFLMCLIAFISAVQLLNVITHKFFSILAFTNKRVLAKIGIVGIRTLDSPIDKINDFVINQSLFGRFFGYSKISIKTNTSMYVYNFVKDAYKFKDLLVTTDKVHKVEIENKNTSINTSSNKYDNLKKLKELYDSEAITKEEFEKEKKKLLG